MVVEYLKLTKTTRNFYALGIALIKLLFWRNNNQFEHRHVLLHKN